MIRAFNKHTLLGTLVPLLLVCACASAPQASDGTERIVCQGIEEPGADPGRVGDRPVIDGFLITGSGEYGFRACNSDDVFLVQASLAIWDEIGACRGTSGGLSYWVRLSASESASHPARPYVTTAPMADWTQ